MGETIHPENRINLRLLFHSTWKTQILQVFLIFDILFELATFTYFFLFKYLIFEWFRHASQYFKHNFPKSAPRSLKRLGPNMYSIPYTIDLLFCWFANDEIEHRIEPGAWMGSSNRWRVGDPKWQIRDREIRIDGQKVCHFSGIMSSKKSRKQIPRMPCMKHDKIKQAVPTGAQDR